MSDRFAATMTDQPATGDAAQPGHGSASSVIPGHVSDLLESPALAHVATLGPDGAPQTSPVWFHWDGEVIRFGQVEGRRQKLRNLRRDPRIAISIVDPANPYRYLEVRGRVERIDPDPDRAFVRTVSRKYTGGEGFEGEPGDYVTVVMRPEHATAMPARPGA